MAEAKKKLTTYTYEGPISSIPQPDGEETSEVKGQKTKRPKTKDVPLFPGKTVELDPEAETTQTLIARKHLRPVQEPAPAKPSEAAKATTKKGAQ